MKATRILVALFAMAALLSCGAEEKPLPLTETYFGPFYRIDYPKNAKVEPIGNFTNIITDKFIVEVKVEPSEGLKPGDFEGVAFLKEQSRKMADGLGAKASFREAKLGDVPCLVIDVTGENVAWEKIGVPLKNNIATISLKEPLQDEKAVESPFFKSASDIIFSFRITDDSYLGPEKPSQNGNGGEIKLETRFENENLSLMLPSGWEAGGDGVVLVCPKDIAKFDQGFTVTAFGENRDPKNACQSMSSSLSGGTIQKTRIGVNDYWAFEYSVGQTKMVSMFSGQKGKVFLLSTASFDGKPSRTAEKIIGSMSFKHP
ncbi:MAG TPA: hypothetical protein PL190_00715 [Caldisericia bacterium]|nr:MAG: hypothetical protein BWX90_00692 [bacterium ADurb.Bin132]HNY60596.1 hypothetical protein [Caldisericia bacterium]HOC79278.1 hypothetical protein [Caldisericia bacterium]HOG70964.1 hypothetical protein [Caldisericia bacterium]HPA65046.1 hypothetical protein [Caldisericia bacterium]